MKLIPKTPSIPNFITFENAPNVVFPISDFSEEELQEIGDKWTKELIKKSKKKNG